jgi:biopolymer transport protein ExbB/TolQ
MYWLVGLMSVAIVGLIAMFDSLGGDVTVESLAPQLALALKTTLYGAVLSSVYKIMGSRFDQRLKALEYDFEVFSRALQVIIDNEVRVEVQS